MAMAATGSPEKHRTGEVDGDGVAGFLEIGMSFLV
jgi:hypothetical protein